MTVSTIPVVFIADEGYIVPTIVSIQSIIDNKEEDTRYRFYILTSGLSEESTQKLDSMTSDKVEIKVIEASVEKYAQIHHGIENSYCQATETALLKFDIPDLIDENRVIYLDGDIICLHDLSGLYGTDLEGNMLGAVMDSGKVYSKRDFVVNCPTYFNSGVMIMDLDQMRRNNVGEDLYSIKKNMVDCALMDQDVFNTFFENRVKLLPIKYNFLYINLLRARDIGRLEINFLNDLFGTRYVSLSAALNEAVIVHFASKNKPWKDVNVALHDVWMEYFNRSPEAGNTLYLLTQQNNWLMQERQNLSRELSRIKKKNNELKKSNQVFWKGEYYSMRNSLSFRLGRIITALPRFVRDRIKAARQSRKCRETAAVTAHELNIRERDKKIIVSMTSYGQRLNTVHVTIDSILRQTVKPDKIVLCISEADHADLPATLKKYEKKNLIEILVCEDLKSPHMKYFFTMQKYPDDIVITVDDDVIYRTDLIEKLYSSYQLYPDCVSALRVHRIRLNEEGEIRPYKKWKLRSSEYVLVPRHDYFATGVGGVLYPPHLLHEDMFRLDIIRETCLKADDVWLKFMELLNDVKVVLADSNKALEYIENTQEGGLFNKNVDCDQNDVQIQALVDHYGTGIIDTIVSNN